ncbi:MAG: bifunctional (p)ppGpp synthetase/guanosine-3',5'-bis(diphosphate) 3'-pyrophosphohydrolase [Clostridia bacterium]|nr:bifunctional (p)ppGpp synthetase/guanosine-3',5'-bis(diphosphate) 3'-pyrophosphohydrolase [Clostridia bacterium]
MENLLNLAKEKLKDKEYSSVCEYLDLVKNLDSNNQVYNLNLAVSSACRAIKKQLDVNCVIVALIYPFAITDTLGDIELNDDVKNILNSLTALYNIKINNREEEIKAIRSLFLATAKDLRTMILKLCIEVSKLDAFDTYTPEYQAALMDNYKNFYSPISAMLGIKDYKDILENAIFKYNMPKFYEQLSKAVSTCVAEGEEEINKAIEKIKAEFQPTIPNVKVFGRQKTIHSIAKKLMRKNMNVGDIIKTYNGKLLDNYDDEIKDFGTTKLNQIVDVLALMILVNDVNECFSVLGKIFTMFTPLGNFKDYITHPKENGYQSLHTVVLLPSGSPLEIQIRTFDMHEYNEYGFAAHWAYKDNSKVNENDIRINYMRKLMESFKEEQNSNDILDLMTQDVFNERIFVQTPLGKVIELPEGSNPIDFAYNIHSKIGDACIGAKVNGKMCPLNTVLNNGDTVEIITSVNAKGPSRDWLKIVKSNAAKKKINDFFKHAMKDDNIKRGKSMLEQQAKIRNVNLSDYLEQKYLDHVFEKYSFSSLDDMYASVGYGSVTTAQVLNKLLKVYEELNGPKEEYSLKSHKRHDINGGVSVKGYENIMVKYAKCCNPLPGDQIIGYISRAKGITVHRADCPSLAECEIERLIECSWNSGQSSMIGSIVIITQNNAGILSKISKKINDLGINIEGISSKNNSNATTTINLQVSVSSRDELEDLINKLNNFSFVIDIFRV